MASNRLTKAQLINTLAAKLEIKRPMVKAFMDMLLITAKEELLSGKDFVIPGLAKLKMVLKKATKERKGINPFTKKAMIIKAKPASKKIKAIAVRALKNLIKKQ